MHAAVRDLAAHERHLFASDRLYQGLGDRDINVKKNTLMVLNHLILNGMIKVKGQLGEMAKCIEDEDRHVADLARQFFRDLSTKDNALYNNLQDVISHLSVGKHAVDEETFEKTMRYIFTFIEKARPSRLTQKMPADTIYHRLLHRRSRPKASSRSSANASAWPWASDSGVTSPSACPCSRTNRKSLSRGSSTGQSASSGGREGRLNPPLKIAGCRSIKRNFTRSESTSACKRSWPRSIARSCDPVCLG